MVNKVDIMIRAGEEIDDFVVAFRNNVKSKVLRPGKHLSDDHGICLVRAENVRVAIRRM